MSKFFSLLFLSLLSSSALAQFPGPVGTAGCTAIHKDSSIFIGWATGCQVNRGYQNIANPSQGFASTGDSTMALGKADGVQVVSLGDGGWAVLTFDNPIYNGPGFDFAVFENAFIDEFLELAFVEVSSDGVNFFRFKATSNRPTDVQVGPFDYDDNASHYDNLAGKYRALYGTPFDLAELDGISGLDINHITHVKVIDVIGSINPLFATYDKNNNIINEHYPTEFPQGGFDLDAIGVINRVVNSLTEKTEDNFVIYPNPASQILHINTRQQKIASVQITDGYGRTAIYQQNFEAETIHIGSLKQGVYFCKIIMPDGKSFFQKFIKQ
ncbi:MAG: T9SS type A sorting domain-containing protein [Bacteroidia bacterium]|nr:T9SS type A sorting domain-containing protein [Bacteroidia bacterium]MCZ2247685.1 T9SS type A sorting domain-containing protein [Bacteroidia bacterium]